VAASFDVPAFERLDAQALASRQGHRLQQLLTSIYGRNRFYTRKLDEAGVRVDTLRFPDDLQRLPVTTKAELMADQALHPPWGTALTEDLVHYTRYNQTSATTGKPLRWVDTSESWQWMLECWKAVYRAAHVNQSDRILFAFSFGPFLGFWTAFDAACQLGAHAVPAGGMSSHQRLALIDAVEPTVVCCTPTYALRLAEVAATERAEKRPIACSTVQTLIVAGEPGGSIPATRERIAESWGARVIDHHGLTEAGPVSFECWEAPGFLHLNEAEYIGEVLDPRTLGPVPGGQPGELVITNLGRTASPVVRYRTGDVVVKCPEPCPCGRTLARLEGGILGRTDDMVSIRGVNVYPSAIESVVRSFKEIVEFRSSVSRAAALSTLSLEVELEPSWSDVGRTVEGLSRQLHESLGLTVPVRAARPGTLPRFEMKARRFVIEE
jgi:phenylacetate-CoA ligase